MAVLVPLGGTLASCAGGGGGGTGAGPTGTVSDTNPFGMADKSTVDAVIFKGGYGIDYVDFAGKKLESVHAGSTAKISPSTDIAQELQPRFVGGNPPDLIDNSGAKAIGFSTILAQLEDLTSVTEAKNLEGTVIKDTLYEGVLAPGTFDGKLAALNYVLTVYAIWYSASMFDENGWTFPKTWDEALALGGQGQGQGQVPLRLGQGSGHLLPGNGHRVRHQGRRRRRPAGPGKPEAGLLVAAGDPGRLHRAGQDASPSRLLQARWFRHPVHRGAGAVEQRAGRRCSTRPGPGSKTR